MIIGGGTEHIIAQEVAHSIGLQTFVTDGNPDAPGLKTADHFAVVSTNDYEDTLSAALNYEENGNSISGVMTVASDVPFSVAYVADGLGLPGLSVNSARKVSDKVLMKETLRSAAVPIPLFEEINNHNDAKKFAKDAGFTFVVKTLDSRGARGVQRISHLRNISRAFETAKKHSPSGRVMVEEYLDGPQLSVEGAMVEGMAHLPAIFDRNYEYLERFSPFIIENGGEMPSCYSKEIKSKSELVMTQAGQALGIHDGVVKGDFVINNGEVKVIEIAGRLSGGFFGTVATPYSTGVNLVENVMRLAIGEQVTKEAWMPTVNRYACIRFVFLPPGTVEDISGLDKVKHDQSCLYCNVFVKPGDTIEETCSHPNRPAVVVASGEDRIDCINNGNRLIGQIVIKVS